MQQMARKNFGSTQSIFEKEHITQVIKDSQELKKKILD